MHRVTGQIFLQLGKLEGLQALQNPTVSVKLLHTHRKNIAFLRQLIYAEVNNHERTV